MFIKKAGDIIEGPEIHLLVEALAPAAKHKNYVPAYILGIRKNVSCERVGRISLRIGSNTLIDRYAGNIGYSVDRGFRGHGYAGKACNLLVPLARSHEFSILYITCNPDNLASRRTIEKLGAELLGVENVPRDTDMYKRGDRIKLRYAWRINENV